MTLWLLLKYCKSGLRNLLLPPGGALLAILLGLWLWRRAPRLGRALILIATLTVWILSTPFVAARIEAAAQRYPPLNLEQPTQAQAIVILGGGGQRDFAPEYGGPEAEPFLLERLAYGAYVARRTGLPILVTGFHIEAVAMRDTLERHFGVQARWVDDQSYDTFENARNSVRLLHADGIDRIVLITRSTHLWRSTHEFLSAGIQVVPAPVNVSDPDPPRTLLSFIPDASALLRSHDAIYEWLGDLVRQMLALTHLRHH
jgi:uncharacterized SAM-binding protein YcdF (DUF218 family)